VLPKRWSQQKSAEEVGTSTNDNELLAVRTGQRSSSRRTRLCVWENPQDSAGDRESGKSATENEKKIDIKKLHEMSK